MAKKKFTKNDAAQFEELNRLPGTQGLRILFDSDLSEERFEVVIVPASWLAFAARASRSPSVLLENHQRQLPEH